VVDDLRRIAAEAKTGQRKADKVSVEEFVPEAPQEDLDDFFTASTANVSVNSKAVASGTSVTSELNDDDSVLTLMINLQCFVKFFASFFR
jgi:hypothetical protein